MLEFKTPEIDDKAWVDECFKYLKTIQRSLNIIGASLYLVM